MQTIIPRLRHVRIPINPKMFVLQMARRPRSDFFGMNRDPSFRTSYDLDARLFLVKPQRLELTTFPGNMEQISDMISDGKRRGQARRLNAEQID